MKLTKNRNSTLPVSKLRINWTHPVILLLLTTAISAIGWGINRFIVQRDHSDLRFQVEGLSQGINLIANEQPHVNGEPVFCDTAKLTLVLAHNRNGNHPILVNEIAMRAERIMPEPATSKVNCEVDTLSSKPFGIVLRNTYVLEVSDSSRSGRFIESAKPGEAFKVNPNNMLQISNQKQAISLKEDEEPLGYDVFVEAMTPGLYRVWFTANYDASGPKVTKTQSFILGK